MLRVAVGTAKGYRTLPANGVGCVYGSSIYIYNACTAPRIVIKGVYSVGAEVCLLRSVSITVHRLNTAAVYNGRTEELFSANFGRRMIATPVPQPP